MAADRPKQPRRSSLDAVEALFARARAVAAAARREVARSRLLAIGVRLDRDPEALARRCAWCGRYESEGEWVEGVELPATARTAIGDAPSRLTHTICPDCFAASEAMRER